MGQLRKGTKSGDTGGGAGGGHCDTRDATGHILWGEAGTETRGHSSGLSHVAYRGHVFGSGLGRWEPGMRKMAAQESPSPPGFMSEPVSLISAPLDHHLEKWIKQTEQSK